MKECGFCKLVYGFENPKQPTLPSTRHFLIFHADFPKNSGQLLVVFKRCVSSLNSNEETTDWLAAMKKACEYLDNFLKNETISYKYKIEMSYGSSLEDQSHFHFYVTPVDKESLKNSCSGKCSLDVRNTAPPNCS